MERNIYEQRFVKTLEEKFIDLIKNKKLPTAAASTSRPTWKPCAPSNMGAMRATAPQMSSTGGGCRCLESSPGRAPPPPNPQVCCRGGRSRKGAGGGRFAGNRCRARRGHQGTSTCRRESSQEGRSPPLWDLDRGQECRHRRELAPEAPSVVDLGGEVEKTRKRNREAYRDEPGKKKENSWESVVRVVSSEYAVSYVHVLTGRWIISGRK